MKFFVRNKIKDLKNVPGWNREILLSCFLGQNFKNNLEDLKISAAYYITTKINTLENVTEKIRKWLYN